MTQSQHDSAIKRYNKAIKKWEKMRDQSINGGALAGLILSICAFLLGIVFAIVLDTIPAIVFGTLFIVFSLPGIVGFAVLLGLTESNRARAPEKIKFFQKKIEDANKDFFGYVDVKSTDKSNDNVDQLIKYKRLLDEGVITQEEFDKKKKELL